MVASKTFGVVQVRSVAIALVVIAVLLLGALGLQAMTSGQAGSAAQTSSAKAFPYGSGDSHQDPGAREKTESHGPR